MTTMKASVNTPAAGLRANLDHLLFRAHNKYTDKYVKAVKNNDASARAAVEKRIDGFTTELAAFLDSATAGNLPKQPDKKH